MIDNDKIAEALVGKTISSFELDGLGDYIIFYFKDYHYNDVHAPVKLVAFGDCCSRSWIESIDAPTALIGTVKSAEQIEMPNLGDSLGTPKNPNSDVVKYYGLKIVTDQGHAVLDYRNDSNGYYGGYLEVVSK